MTAHTPELSAELLCHRCGYDLRAHPQDGKCPECGASVAESRQAAATPRRPAWRDTDPRWRRRMLAGTWVLVLLPLMDVLQMFGWASRVPVPNLFGYRGAVTLDETFLLNLGVYQPVLFCIGMVLLFSKERGRRPAQLDWTRRWGVLCSYVVFLLNAAPILFISALVLAGISAVFLTLPLKYQPAAMPIFLHASAWYVRYGPQPKAMAGAVLVAFSSITILLACVPLFQALSSTGPKRPAAILLAPLALFALLHLAHAGWHCLTFSSQIPPELYRYKEYFYPRLFVEQIAELMAGLSTSGSVLGAFAEATKWFIVLAIALWLSIAQLAAWRLIRRSKTESIPSA